MTPAEQVFTMMQQLSAEQQQAVLHLVKSFQTPSVKPQINHSVLADIEGRQDPERARREMWGDDEG